MISLLEDLNPWWFGEAASPLPPFPIERRLFPRIWERLIDPMERRASIVFGARQVGKTTLAIQLIQRALREGWPRRNVVYVNLEEDELRPVRIRELVREVKAQGGREAPFLFVFDEVQYSESWAVELKNLVDGREGRFLVTGSGSSRIFEETEESLQGRSDHFFLHGLNLAEFVDLRRAASGVSTADALSSIKIHLEAYLGRGGFPELALMESLPRVRLKVRQDIGDRAISKDIVARLRLQSDFEIRQLFQHLVRGAGKIVKLKELAGKVGAQAGSAGRWIRELEKASLLFLLPAVTCNGEFSFARGRHPKVYPTDPAFAAAHSKRVDLGIQVECSVFRHLLEVKERLETVSASEIVFGYYSEQGSEADFVLCDGGRLLLVEATSSSVVARDKAVKFGKLAAKLRPARAVLVSLYPEREVLERGGAQVEFVPLWQFLLDCCGEDPGLLFGSEGDA